jgi:ADP-ribose pyrophosphatase YjhB (NUDIX family)
MATQDLYNGLIVDTKTIEESSDGFENSLNLLLTEAKADKKNLIWLDLTIKQNEHIAIALKHGFEFHNCEAHRVMLTHRVKPDAYIPVPPSHTIGVGAVVINEKDELLMVKDRICSGHSSFKFPGGMMEHADRLLDGVIREVYEETGIKGEFIKMVTILNSHPYRFNKSNIYILFQLKALSSEINIIDTHEIAEAIWMPMDEFYADSEMSQFQKTLLDTTLNKKGLLLMDKDIHFSSKKFVEIYG